jgi:hypothetical protein
VNLGPTSRRRTEFSRSANPWPMPQFRPAGTNVDENCGEKGPIVRRPRANALKKLVRRR